MNYSYLLLSILYLHQSFGYRIQVNKNTIEVDEHPKGFGTAKRAVIIGIDGFGGVYLRNISKLYPGFRTFFDFGAHTTMSRNQAPTVSGPNWAAYLTGMSATQSGVYENSWTVDQGNPADLTSNLPPVSGRGRPQTMFSITKNHDSTMKTALIYTWGWFNQIANENPHVDYAYWSSPDITCNPNETEYHCSNRMDWNVQEKFIENMIKNKPTLSFLHFDAVDASGHSTFWGSEAYYEIVAQKDEQVTGILEALTKITDDVSGKPILDETLIVVVADHGGYRASHGITPPMICEAYVPLLFLGPGVKNINMEDYGYPDVSSLDMPVTVLNALGIHHGEFMRGRVLEEIYGDDDNKVSIKK